MADAAEHVVARELIPEPDISHLVMEDGAPVDGIFSERQMRLLTETLYTSWRDAEGHLPVFVALANVGLFFGLNEPPVVPDVMLSLDARLPEEVSSKKHRSYLVWEYGKPPDVVFEVVSNREGGEEKKLLTYARIGVPYAVIYDPDEFLSRRPLRVYGHHERSYVEILDPSWLTGVELGLMLWQGTYEGMEGIWLRWCDREGKLLPTGAEASDAATQRADAERERADRLAARLRELGHEA